MQKQILNMLLLGIITSSCQSQSVDEKKLLDFGTTQFIWTTFSNKPLDFGATQYSWLTDKWSGDERPYRQIRDDIDKAFAQNKVSQRMLSRYELRAKKTPFDPLERFGQIYAIYKGASEHYPLAEKEIYKLYGAFRDIPLAHKYEFTRAQFLVYAFCSPHPRLEPIGTKLVQVDPKDYSVKREMTQVLDTRDSKQRKRALIYAQDLRRLRPQSAQPYASVASVYWRSWLTTRSPIERQLAVMNYQKFLQLALPSDPFRPQAKKLIKMITSS